MRARPHWFTLALVLAAAGPRPAPAGAKLVKYETRFYTLYTDLDDAGVQETTLRLGLMAEEYHERTRGFAGTIERRLPFYLFSKHADYVAAGGHPKSAGVFDGRKLMAYVNPKQPDAAWHVIQHEGFHQFIHAAIGEGVPIWANEGLAEYFGNGLFTGDNFIIGLIDPQRLERIKAGIRGGTFITLREMMLMSPAAWSDDLKGANYDQAWSMVYFLAHAEDGKYQKAFLSFLADVSKRRPWDAAWTRNFGNDVNGFQQRWEEYWLALPDAVSHDLYAEAIVCQLTSFYARAFAARQVFNNFDDFIAAANSGALKISPANWLPPRMLADVAAVAPRIGAWTCVKRSGQRALQCQVNDGPTLEGSFQIQNEKVESVTVRSVKPARGR